MHNYTNYTHLCLVIAKFKFLIFLSVLPLHLDCILYLPLMSVKKILQSCHGLRDLSLKHSAKVGR
jgi:hypothetical protein